MMELEDFTASLARNEPDPALSILLQALWHDARGDWHRAHELTQKQDSTEAAWVHAYLHRKEGDAANARYWYRRAGRKEPQVSLEQEWRAIAAVLITGA